MSGSLTANVQSSQEKSMDNSEQLDWAEAVLKSGIHSFKEKIAEMDQSLVNKGQWAYLNKIYINKHLGFLMGLF